MIHWLSQMNALLQFNLLSLPTRMGSVLSSAVGIAGVVAVFVGVLSIAAGFRSAMVGTGSDDVVLILRSGADTEMVSGLSLDETRIIADAPGLARSASAALAAAELFVIINLPKQSTVTDANVPLRGVETASYDVRGNVELVEGRRFEPGKNEIIVGQGAATAFSGLEVGNSLTVGANTWTVVGHFAAGGGIAESEIWADAAVLQAAYRRGASYQSVIAKLQSPGALEQLEQALSTDPRLNVRAMRQSDYYSAQSVATTALITTLGGLIAGLMSIGAIFGALNTMYTSVASRSREIATLRALGFRGSPIVVAVLMESLLIALVSGALGGVGAWLAFDGYRSSTINFQSFSQVTFAFQVTPLLLVLGTLCAAIIGLFGGLFPAVRAARLPVAIALRE
jgi:putative ABC transport system permease protein